MIVRLQRRTIGEGWDRQAGHDDRRCSKVVHRWWPWVGSRVLTMVSTAASSMMKFDRHTSPSTCASARAILRSVSL